VPKPHHPSRSESSRSGHSSSSRTPSERSVRPAPVAPKDVIGYGTRIKKLREAGASSWIATLEGDEFLAADGQGGFAAIVDGQPQTVMGYFSNGDSGDWTFEPFGSYRDIRLPQVATIVPNVATDAARIKDIEFFTDGHINASLFNGGGVMGGVMYGIVGADGRRLSDSEFLAENVQFQGTFTEVILREQLPKALKTARTQKREGKEVAPVRSLSAYGSFRFARLFPIRFPFPIILQESGGFVTFCGVIGGDATGAGPIPPAITTALGAFPAGTTLPTGSGFLPVFGQPLLAAQYIAPPVASGTGAGPTAPAFYYTTVIPPSPYVIPAAYSINSDACGLQVCCLDVVLWIGVTVAGPGGAVTSGAPTASGTIVVQGFLGTQPVGRPFRFTLTATSASSPLVPYVVTPDPDCSPCPFDECVPLRPLRDGTTSSFTPGYRGGNYFSVQVTSTGTAAFLGALTDGTAFPLTGGSVIAVVATARTLQRRRPRRE